MTSLPGLLQINKTKVRAVVLGWTENNEEEADAILNEAVERGEKALECYTIEQLAGIDLSCRLLRIAGEVFLVRHWTEVSNAVYRYALSLAKNREDAEDIAQDSLWKGLRAIANYSYEDLSRLKFLALLYKIAHDFFVNEYRKKKRHPTDSLEASHLDILYQQEASSYDQPEVAFVLKELIDEIEQKAEALPENLRHVWRLAILLGMPDEEIAKRLGLKISTVQVYRSESRKQLWKAFHQPEEGGQ